MQFSINTNFEPTPFKPFQETQLSQKNFISTSRHLLPVYLSRNYSKSFINSKSSINIHRAPSNQKHFPDPFSVPSIVSSVLHLRHKAQETSQPSIHPHQGGGFRGKIKKSVKSRAVQSKFSILIEKPHQKTHSHTDIIKTLRKYSNSSLKSSSRVSFKANVLGRRLSVPDPQELTDSQSPSYS
jgi:hypothetical protein